MLISPVKYNPVRHNRICAVEDGPGYPIGTDAVWPWVEGTPEGWTITRSATPSIDVAAAKRIMAVVSPATVESDIAAVKRVFAETAKQNTNGRSPIPLL